MDEAKDIEVVKDYFGLMGKVFKMTDSIYKGYARADRIQQLLPFGDHE